MSRPVWIDPFSPEGLQIATSKVLSGINYRLFFDGVTRSRLLEAYGELADIARRHPHDDDKWKQSVREQVTGLRQKDDIRHWLLGLAKKTATNLGIKSHEYPRVFDMVMEDIENYPTTIPTRDTALLLWCGAATLTIRGSMKARVGKALESCLARSALCVCGLDEASGDFRVNIAADQEVSRQTDAEIRSPRGWIRMEVGLIGKGNSEVTGDKIERMSRNSIVLFDLLPPTSSMWRNAQDAGVKLIQLRSNNAIEELRHHLQELRVPVVQDALSLDTIEDHIMQLPLDLFEHKRPA